MIPHPVPSLQKTQRFKTGIRSLNRFFSKNSLVSQNFDEIIFDFQERLQAAFLHLEPAIILIQGKRCWLYEDQTKRRVIPNYKGFSQHLKPVSNFCGKTSPGIRFVSSIGQFFKKPGYVRGLPLELLSGNRFWILLNAKSSSYLEENSFSRLYPIFQKLAACLSGAEYDTLNRQIEGFKFQEQAVVTLAHQLKSPLSAIESAMNTLKPYLKNQALLIECIDRIKRTRTLLDEYLNFMKITQITLTSTPLLFFKTEIENYYRFPFTENKIKLRVEIPPEAENDCIMAHPALALQAIQNIIDNAQQAINHSGKISLSMQKTRISTQNAVVKFTFTDSGPGIAAELCDRIFDPFISGSKQGHGLGLSICRRIMTLHGGGIEHIPKSARFNDRFILTFKASD